MLTPQDIKEKTFAKAVFGGYDMTAVDDFLETVVEDYANLFKESAILKSKIKVLVEKVEEYRSTEDAMRMALLTAQKMGDDLIDETKKKCDKMLKDAESEISSRKENFSVEFADEEARLNAARAETEKFVSESEELMRRHAEFLSKLDGITHETVSISSIQDEPEAEEAEFEPEAEQEPEETEDVEKEMDDAIKEIDKFVSDVMEDQEKEEAEEAAEPEQPTRKYTEWTEEDELATPRPKFDFDNLKFGSNYFED